MEMPNWQVLQDWHHREKRPVPLILETFMYEIPGSCIRVAFVPEGTSSHSQEFVDAGKTQAARDCILYGAKSIAGASMDLITKPELMDEVKAEFAENKKKFK